MATSKTRRRPALRPRVKVWLEMDGDYVFGYGIARILQALEEAGSIKEAAGQLGKSYRYVWGRIKQAEAALGRPLVESRVGGAGARRTCLTEDGRRWTKQFLALRERVAARLQKDFERGFGSSAAAS